MNLYSKFLCFIGIHAFCPIGRKGLTNQYACAYCSKKKEEKQEQVLVKTKCPSCNSDMVFEEFEDVVERNGKSKVICVLGWHCNFCGEAILSGTSLVKSNEVWKSLL